MKIAILSPFYPYRGGLAQLNARLYGELSKTNLVKAFNFTCLYPEFLFPGKTQYVNKNDTATPIESERVLNTINPLSYIKTTRRIKQFAPDVLIIPYWMSFFAPAFSTVAMLQSKKTKIVVLVHNAIPHERRFFDNAFSRFLFNRSNGLIALSENVKKDILSLKKDAKILLTEHPIYDHYGEKIDRDVACEKLNIQKDKKNLLFFGFIRHYKGLDILIEAMNWLDDSYQLIIAGESYGSFEKYETMINASPLKNNIVVFAEYIPDSTTTTLFSAADALVLPYRSATQSGVVALALQLETPMIATNVGALGSAIRLSQTGLVVNQITAEALAKGITEFFGEESESYVAQLKKEKARLSWSSFARNVESFLLQI